ncbi:hypothetical protein TNCV_3312701 [Trichonephila clavipes]|nr:hypothetical protein TNCV_3312701 [Trichonephila clavipes]
MWETADEKVSCYGFPCQRTVTLIRRIHKERNSPLRSLMDEVETDQAREEPDEIMDINHYRERKFEKSDEHMKRLSLERLPKNSKI